MREFKYDVKTLIEGVRNRPCLWNKSLEVYKDRLERQNAWEEIFHILDPRYELMPLEERRLTGEHVVNKWTNIRDTFVKSLKTKLGKPKRKYILYNQMKFLINDLNIDLPEQEPDTECVEDNISYMKEENESEPEVVETTSAAVPRKRTKRVENSDDDDYVPREESSSYNSKKRSRKKDTPPEEHSRKSKYCDTSTNSADLDFVEIESGSDQRLMNEDEAFFASLLPSVVKYNEDERLTFRIEVLGVMKRIKENRKWNIGEDT